MAQGTGQEIDHLQGFQSWKCIVHFRAQAADHDGHVLCRLEVQPEAIPQLQLLHSLTFHSQGAHLFP